AAAPESGRSDLKKRGQKARAPAQGGRRMPRPKSLQPKMYPLASEGVYCVNLGGQRVRLGRDLATAERAYRRGVSEWLGPGQAPGRKAASGLTVTEALARYCDHVRPSVAQAQYVRVSIACAAAAELYLDTPVEGFDQLALQAVRQHLLASPDRRRAGSKAP